MLGVVGSYARTVYEPPIYVRVPVTLRDAMRKAAKARGVSVTRLTRKALTVYMAKHFGYVEPPPEPEPDPLP